MSNVFMPLIIRLARRHGIMSEARYQEAQVPYRIEHFRQHAADGLGARFDDLVTRLYNGGNVRYERIPARLLNGSVSYVVARIQEEILLAAVQAVEEAAAAEADAEGVAAVNVPALRDEITAYMSNNPLRPRRRTSEAAAADSPQRAPRRRRVDDPHSASPSGRGPRSIAVAESGSPLSLDDVSEASAAEGSGDAAGDGSSNNGGDAVAGDGSGDGSGDQSRSTSSSSEEEPPRRPLTDRQRLYRAEQRVAGLQLRMSHVEHDLQGLDQRVRRLDERVTRLDERVTRLDERVARLDERVTRLDERVTRLDERVTNGFDLMERRFNEVLARLPR
jgi:hypothetical protein